MLAVLGGIDAGKPDARAVNVQRVVDADTPDCVAERVVVPAASAVASPCVPAAFDTLATAACEDAHVTWAVTSCVLPSEYVPVAVSCTVVPFAACGFVGVTTSEVSVALVTVTVLVPLTPLRVAETSAVPAETAVARPCVPLLLETVTAALFELAHDACEVRSWKVPSENVPVAVNSVVVPAAIVGSTGFTSIDVRTAFVTVTLVVVDTPPMSAVMVAPPTPAALTSPCDPPAFETVATDGADVLHDTWPVRSCVDESE